MAGDSTLEIAGQDIGAWQKIDEVVVIGSEELTEEAMVVVRDGVG